jgi:deoxyadenosine/deoxycytidine kinase
MFTIIDEFLPKPELLVYLYLEIPNLQRNIRNRGRTYEQEIQDSYLQNIQQGYLEHIRKIENQRILILDTNNIDFVNNPGHYDSILSLIDQDYPTGVHRFTL